MGVGSYTSIRAMIVEDKDTDDSYRVESKVEAFAVGFQMDNPVIHDSQNLPASPADD